MNYGARSSSIEGEFCPLAPKKLLEHRLKTGKYIYTVLGLEVLCAGCKEYWPADTEFFFYQKNHDSGLHCWCKACYVAKRYPNGRREIHMQEAA